MSNTKPDTTTTLNIMTSNDTFTNTYTMKSPSTSWSSMKNRMSGSTIISSCTILLLLSAVSVTSIDAKTTSNYLSKRAPRNDNKNNSKNNDTSKNNSREILHEMILEKRSISQEEIQRMKVCESPLRLQEMFSFEFKDKRDEDMIFDDDNDGDEMTIEELFLDEIDEAWSFADRIESQERSSNDYDSLSTSSSFPFLTCVNNALVEKSGAQRSASLMKLFRLFSIDGDGENKRTLTPTMNDQDKSCFIVRVTSSNAKQIASLPSDENIFIPLMDEYSIIPYTSSMKMEQGLLEDVKQRIISLDESNSTSSLEFMVKLSSTDGGNAVNYTLDNVRAIVPSMIVASVDEDENETNDNHEGRQLRRKAVVKSKAKLKSVYSLLPQDYPDVSTPRSLEETASMDCSRILDTMRSKQLSSSAGFKLSLQPVLERSKEAAVRCALLVTAALSYNPEVLSIALIPQFRTFNHVASNIVQGATVRPFQPFSSAGLDGEGQIVAVSDTGLDVDNCYFYDAEGQIEKDGSVQGDRRKVVQYTPVEKDGPSGYYQDDVGGHGTHVCGTVAGHMARDGIQQQEADYNGVAPAAKIAFLDISLGGDFLNPPSDSNDLFGPGSAAGAQTHVASWGANVGLNSYSSFSAEYDKYLFENQNMVFVVAAGNFGLNGVSFPGTSKNAITVGATLNSYGPDRNKILGMSGGAIVEGNRKKPEILAPGSFIGSAYSGLTCDDVLWKEGTSMSAPVVGGAVALIRQFFQRYPQQQITLPSASLIKAILINGAQPLYGAGTIPYDYRQNFGLANLLHSLPLESNNNDDIHALFYNLVHINDGDIIQYNVTIDNPSCSAPLSAALAWHDISTSPYVLNDLDLLIIETTDAPSQNQTLHYPNGQSSRDEFNNAERIRIDNINHQHQITYTIQVSAFNLILPSIPYSLVITGCFTNSSAINQEVEEEPLFEEGEFIIKTSPISRTNNAVDFFPVHRPTP